MGDSPVCVKLLRLCPLPLFPLPGQQNTYFNFWAITGWLATAIMQVRSMGGEGLAEAAQQAVVGESGWGRVVAHRHCHFAGDHHYGWCRFDLTHLPHTSPHTLLHTFPHLQVGIIMVLVLVGCQPTVINRATGHPYGSYEVQMNAVPVVA